MWDYICPRCRREVDKNSHKCPYCGERFPFPLKVPPRCLKDNKALEEYVHKHVFPKVSAWQREYLAQYFTTIFSDGFESGNFSAWTGTGVTTGETATVVTTDPHHGTYHADFETDGSSLFENCYAYKTFTEQATVYSRAYIKFKTVLPASEQYYLPMQHVGTDWITMLRVYNDAGTLKWRVYYHNGTSHLYADSTSPTINLDTWYCIELYTKVDATTGEVKLYVDGVERVSVTGLDTTAHGNITRFEVGEREAYGGSGNAPAHGVYVDCVVVADTYIGPEGGTQTKTYTVDVLFKKLGLTKTYTTDTLFQKQNITKTYTIDTLLKKLGLTKDYSVDALFKKLGIPKTYTIDTIFQAQAVTTKTKTYTIDTLLKKLGITTSYSIDTLFQKLGLTKTYTVDSTFVLRKTKTYTLDTLLKKYNVTRTYTIDTIIGQPTPEAPVGGGFPFWWEKAETWAPSLFALFRRERAYYQTQIRLAKKEKVVIPALIKIAKPSRTTIKTQPIIMAEETKTTISTNVVLAKPSQTTIEAAPFKAAEPAMNIIPSEIKMLTYPELIRTVKVIHKKRKGRR